MTRGHHFEENLTPCGATQAVLPRRATQNFLCVYLLSTCCQLFVRGQTHQSSVMCGCTRNGAARNKTQKVKASRWKMEAASRRQPACESEPAGGGTQQATASRREQEASRRQPAYESGHARGGSQQATASRREQEASRRKPQVEDGCQQATASRRERTDKLTRESRKPAGASQQVEGGCQQATASRREREQTS